MIKLKNNEIWKKMETAPKDRHILILWKEIFDDYNNIMVFESWWWVPAELYQWEAGSRPHWEYVSHVPSQSCYEIKNPLGWLPIPETVDTKQCVIIITNAQKYMFQGNIRYACTECKAGTGISCYSKFCPGCGKPLIFRLDKEK